MAAVNVGSRARHPPLLYIALAMGAHQSQMDWAPRSGAERESSPIFGSGLEINSNTYIFHSFINQNSEELTQSNLQMLIYILSTNKFMVSILSI